MILYCSLTNTTKKFVNGKWYVKVNGKWKLAK